MQAEELYNKTKIPYHYTCFLYILNIVWKWLIHTRGAGHKWCQPFSPPCHPFYYIGLWSKVTFWQIPPSEWRHLWKAPKRVYILGQAQPTKVLLLHIHSKLHSNPDLLAFIPKSQVLLACYMAFRTFRSIANFHAGARCNFNTFKKTFRRITNDHDFGKKEREKK